jgi:hypothetical protein
MSENLRKNLKWPLGMGYTGARGKMIHEKTQKFGNLVGDIL